MRHWSWRGMPSARAGAQQRTGSRRRRRDTAPSGIGVFALDGGVITPTAILAGIGLVMVYSATAPLAMGAALPPHFVRHLFALGAALLCVIVVVRVPLVVWRRCAFPLWGMCIVLLLLTLLVGVEAGGARRWLAVPGLPMRLQACEIAKWVSIVAVAAALANLGERHKRAGRELVAAIGLALPPALLLLGQPDLGSAVLLLAIVGLMVFAAGAPLLRLGAGLLFAAAGAAVYVALHPYALARFRGYLAPWETASAEGFQLVQSFVAFGRGGIGGVGLGDGRQKLFYLPEAHTDFILSVIAEELGLIGVLVVLGAFAALVIAGTRLAGRARDPFPLLLGVGMTGLIALSAMLNAAVVTGLLPTTGLTLPFLSFGGNSLLVCSLAVAVLLRIGLEAPVAAQGRGTARGTGRWSTPTQRRQR